MWTWTFENFSLGLPPPERLHRRSAPWIAKLGTLNWREDGEAYFLEGSLPGFRKRDIAIEARERTLDIRAERRRGVWKKEHRSFRQSVTLPSGADASAIRASFEGDRLSICIPKLAHARRRIVPVRVNGELPAAPVLARLEHRPASWFRELGAAVRHLASALRARFT